MAGVCTKTGQVQILNLVLNIANNKLKLFSNNVTPTVDTVLGDLNVVSGGGYADVTLVAANWVISPGSPSSALYNAFINFTFTGVPAVATVYGYFIVDNGGNLLFVERFSQVVSPVNGTVIPVKPKATCANV